ncbi:MAG TPA: hypothetical protein VGQ99_16005 [Tepidisphaeraceae bacterium]|jgi:hypothetical protein|nr:hypothetical protein [Tepidisphaeraceae bacterium]
MQRIEDGALIVSCDFCRTDWDGVSPVIEGHRGAIICLECLKLALDSLTPAGETFKCILCLREPLPATLPRWHHPQNPATHACEGCIHQTADVFDRDPDIDWHWIARPPASGS